MVEGLSGLLGDVVCVIAGETMLCCRNASVCCKIDVKWAVSVSSGNDFCCEGGGRFKLLLSLS